MKQKEKKWNNKKVEVKYKNKQTGKRISFPDTNCPAF